MWGAEKIINLFPLSADPFLAGQGQELVSLYSWEKKLWHIRRMGSSVVYEALERGDQIPSAPRRMGQENNKSMDLTITGSLLNASQKDQSLKSKCL